MKNKWQLILLSTVLFFAQVSFADEPFCDIVCNPKSSCNKYCVEREGPIQEDSTCGIYGLCYKPKPIYEGENLSSNRLDSLANETLQVTVFYDGRDSSQGYYPFLLIKYRSPDNSTGWITVNDIDKFSTTIETRQYDLNGCVLTGEFKVSGVKNDGGVDGMAFGLYWKDKNGKYHILKSNSSNLSSDSTFIGAWPLAMSDSTYVARTPQLTDGNARHQSKAAIYGSKLLGNSTYYIDIY